MKTMIKYELKKIFQSKLALTVFALMLVSTLVIAISDIVAMNTKTYSVSYGQLLPGADKKKVPETVISEKDIDAFTEKLHAFEARDEIYEKVDMENFEGNLLCGKYRLSEAELSQQISEGYLTPEEVQLMLENAYTYNIKEEYRYDYFQLYAPVKTYNETVELLQEYKGLAQSSVTKQKNAFYNFLADKLENKLKNGITVGYEYGWHEVFSSISVNIAPALLAAVIIFGLCFMFNGEYAMNTDAILLTSKNGRKQLARAKILSSVIYCFICWLAYVLLNVLTYFLIFGTEGGRIGFIDTNLQHLLKTLPFVLLGCVLLGLVTITVSAVTTKQITGIFISVLLGVFPIADILFPSDNRLVSLLLQSMPFEMIFGRYLAPEHYGSYLEVFDTLYVYLFGNIYNLQVLFIPVGLIITAVTIPIIYKAYCNRQVTN